MNDLNKLMEEFDKAQSFHDKMMVNVNITNLGQEAMPFVIREPEIARIAVRISKFATENGVKFTSFDNHDNKLGLAFLNEETDSGLILSFFDEVDEDFEQVVYDFDFKSVEWPKAGEAIVIEIYSKKSWEPLNENNNG